MSGNSYVNLTSLTQFGRKIVNGNSSIVIGVHYFIENQLTILQLTILAIVPIPADLA